MGFLLTDADAAIAKSVLLEISGGDPITGFPAGGGGRIEFQFPPKIKTDSKSMSWMNYLETMVWEPQYMWKGGKPRKIQLSATYVVGGPTNNGDWSAVRVANELRRFKSYFYTGGPDNKFLPIIIVDMYEVVPQGEESGQSAKFRGLDVSIKYSDELIRADGIIHPIRADITLNLELVSNIAAKDGEKQYEYGNLEDQPDRNWY